MPTTVQLPARLAQSTYLAYNNARRVVSLSEVRLADATSARVLRTAPIPNYGLLAAARAPNGDLLVEGCTPPACAQTPPQYEWSPVWTDQRTGVTFPGEHATMSPDGRSVVTVVTEPNRQATVRTYDFTTGRTSSSLIAVEAGDQYTFVTGVGWSGDGQSVFVAKNDGLYVVPRDAATLPSAPTVPNQTVHGLDTYFPEAALLANDHVVAFQSTSIQHTGWPGALVDIDVATGTVRTVLGSVNPGGPSCGTRAAKGKARCDLSVDSSSIAARDNDALVNSAVAGQVWLYDGNSARVICAHCNGVTPSW